MKLVISAIGFRILELIVFEHDNVDDEHDNQAADLEYDEYNHENIKGIRNVVWGWKCAKCVLIVLIAGRVRVQALSSYIWKMIIDILVILIEEISF